MPNPKYDYHYIVFEKTGEFRGFALGLNKTEFLKEIKEEAKTKIVLWLSESSHIPPHFLEGNYAKSSKNRSDINDFILHLQTTYAIKLR